MLTWSRAIRLVSVVALLMVAYLGLIAVFEDVQKKHAPPALRWFGEPGSWVTVAIVTAVLVLVGLLAARPEGARRPGVPIAVVAGLAVISVFLGITSYAECADEHHPPISTALIWTAALFTGSTDDLETDGAVCPSPPPVALEIARLSALAALFLSVLGVAAMLFQSRLDRIRAYFAHSITAVVDIDDDAQSMLSAIAQTLDRRSMLVLLTASPDLPAVHEARNQGARVVSVDFNRPDLLKSLSLWRKLERLYLLSADPSANLLRLTAISERLNQMGNKHRLPLIVRIDDPWQAESWRAQHFGGAGTLWAADAVGRYEVTARRLLDLIIAMPEIRRIVIGGTSRLTLALCSDMAQRRLERAYAQSGDESLPRLILVAEDAEEYVDDHRYARKRLGAIADTLAVDAVVKRPTVSNLAAVIESFDDASSTAVILVDDDGTTGTAIDATTGTRLAVRFPDSLIYAWDPSAEVTEDRWSIVGRLKTYRLSMDVPQGQAQDAWERAARLIHDRYATKAAAARAEAIKAGRAVSARPSPASLPWTELSEFYRGSNRRQVRNALWMVEQIGGHTWDTWGCPHDSGDTPNLRDLPTEEQLRVMGFDLDSAKKMAQAEHEDWCRYYRDAGWKYGPDRDDSRKIHPGLVDWDEIKDNDELLGKALDSLATTLVSLRELGYRSRPARNTREWQVFRRVGTVVAEQRSSGWTWNTQSGQTMRANAGDWEVREAGGEHSWSVRDDIFRARHSHVGGKRWRRNGTVRARPAEPGEVVGTLEGRARAKDGDWIVQGEHGDQWPVPAEEFRQRYEGPVDAPAFRV